MVVVVAAVVVVVGGGGVVVVASIEVAPVAVDTAAAVAAHVPQHRPPAWSAPAHAIALSFP